MRHPSSLHVALLALILAGCGSNSSPVQPIVTDMASVVFKLDASTCPLTQTIVFSIDASQMGTQVLSPGSSSMTFGTTATHHSLSAKAVGSVGPFKSASEAVTLSKDEVHQTLLSC